MDINFNVGLEFHYHNRLYKLLHITEVRVGSAWLQGIVYQALYEDERVKFGSVYTRLAQEHPDFIEAIQRTSGRRNGNTTRLADWYIQQFFSMLKGEFRECHYIHDTGRGMYIRDHHSSVISNKRLLKIVENRLREEHSREVFRINQDKQSIEIDTIISKED